MISDELDELKVIIDKLNEQGKMIFLKEQLKNRLQK